ncbi:MAG: citryl-CoA lyase [Candidatus Thermoplasmatota archaeon]
MTKWKTSITKIEPNHIVTKGYRQEDLIGTVPFAHVVYLLLKDALPTPEQGMMMDAILTACVDHGVTPPSSIAARTVASGGVPLPTAVAAGVLSIGDAHGGAIEKAALLLQNGVAQKNKENKTIPEIACSIVQKSAQEKKRIPGFGHRIHTADPRTKKLFILAEQNGIAADHVHLAQAIASELEKTTGKQLPINVDGAIAAIISDMGFDWRLGKAFFVLGRVAGLVAQVYEEQTMEKPMREMFTIDYDYVGPSERKLPR